MIHPKSSERGQILILLALFVMILLVVAALVIDAGMVVSNRQLAQRVADSASQAGANKIKDVLNQKNPDGSPVFTGDQFACSDAKILLVMDQAKNEAMLRASVNNIFLDEDISDGHGVQVVCSDDRDGVQKYIEVVVKIQSETDTAFAQLFFGNSHHYTVESTSRAAP